jgi:hypothetical protein
MPQEQKAKKSSPVEPSQGFLQRIFGSSPMTPEMEQGLNIARQEMPDLAPVETYGPISRLLMSGANAYASPGKSIYLNPKQLQGYSPEDIADVLTHEQTHIKQMNQRGTNPITEVLSNSIFGRGLNPNEPYHRRPDEMEAFQAERDRRLKQGRGQTAIPSFATGEYYTPRDIRLRPPSQQTQQPSIEERQRKLLGGDRSASK